MGIMSIEMIGMKTLLLGLVMALGLTASARAQVRYACDFEKTEVGKVPDDFMVLDGHFAVQAEGGNKVLELPGAPVDTYGVLFGAPTNAGVAVSARVYGTSRGRRQPAFAIGLNGAGGFRLQVAPGRRALEILRGDESVASVPFAWEAGGWTRLRLAVRKTHDGEWRVEGKAWKDGAAEPPTWTISKVETTEPSPGRASLWGSPISGTPLRFDDLEVTSLSP